MDADCWPGGRTPLVHRGRHLPRFLTEIPKDQQAILESAHAWQPSISSRQISGSVPIQLLNHFQELADEVSQEGAFSSESNVAASPLFRSSQEVKRPCIDQERDDTDTAPQSSESEASEIAGWSQTQRSPAAERPALPDDSSPLSKLRGQPAQSLVRIDNPVIEGECFHTQLSCSGEPLPAPCEEEEVPSETEKASKAPFKESISTQASQHGASESPISHCSPGQRPIFNNSRPKSSQIAASKSGPEHVQSSSSPQSNEPSIKKIETHINSDSRLLIQVHRTPFGNQSSTSQRITSLQSPAAKLHHAPNGEASSSDQEIKSSVSVIPGTFSNVRVGHSPQIKKTYQPSQGKIQISGSERTKSGKGQGYHQLSSFDILDTGFKAHPSTRRRLLQDQRCASEPQGVKRKRSSGNAPHHQAQKPRLAPTLPASDVLGDNVAVETASEIARESRRTFFRNRPTTTHSSSSSSVASRSQRMPEQRQAGLTSKGPHSSAPDPFTSYLTHGTKAQHTAQGHTVSHPPCSQSSVYITYKATYPEYRGDALAFQKACRQIRMLEKEGKAPHPCLWDDFIFCRHHDYRNYLLQVAEACEDALPYLQYYNQYIKQPTRLASVVKPVYLRSLAGDSGVGSSVDSHPLAARGGGGGLSERQAASSPTDDTFAGQAAPVAPSAHTPVKLDGCQALGYVQPRQEQDSTVREWVRQQSLQRALGAASPELGSSADDRVQEAEGVAVSLQGIEATETIPRHGIHREAREHPKGTSPWCDDPHTPFKSFVKSCTGLTQEKRQLKEGVQSDGNRALNLHLRSVIDIFSIYRK